MQHLNNFSIVAAFVLRSNRSRSKKQLWHSSFDFRSWFHIFWAFVSACPIITYARLFTMTF